MTTNYPFFVYRKGVWHTTTSAKEAADAEAIVLYFSGDEQYPQRYRRWCFTVSQGGEKHVEGFNYLSSHEAMLAAERHIVRVFRDDAGVT